MKPLVKNAGAWYDLGDFDKMREKGIFQNLICVFCFELIIILLRKEVRV